MSRSFLLLTLQLTLLPWQCANAQQFQHQPGLVPGPVVWSEGVIATDVDGDGDADVVFSNGSGFSGAAGSLAPTLLINTGSPGSPSFLDATAARIPAGFVQQGKGLTACDVDGDGAQDLVFANAFMTQPRLLHNDGTGHFTDETSSRLPGMSLNSFGVAALDVDNDGDLDLVFCDAGPSTFFGPGAPPRLLINDGSGVFLDSPARMNGVNKIAAMQVTAVDIDRDLDLDVIVDGRSPGQHLYLNDGSGAFSFLGTTLPPGSGSVYETDWADLDADGDIDGFYISMSGFSEGTARNGLLPGGNLSFSASTATLAGANGADDNEAAFIDANDDGLLDALVASLGHPQEKLYLNAGTFAPGSFVYQPSGFTTLTDSTLDLTIADFDQDGRYDVVTAQGESGSFLNRYYANTGPIDTHAPVIGNLELPPATVPITQILAGTFGLRAWIQDAVIDSGRDLVHAVASGSAVKDGTTTPFTIPLGRSGGGIHRFTLSGPLLGPELVGTDVTYVIQANDPAGNMATSAAQTFRVCGRNLYGPASGVNVLSLDVTSPPQSGQTTTLTLSGPAPGQAALLLLGAGRTVLPFAGGTVLVDPTTAVVIPFVIPAGGFGVPMTIPADPAFQGALARLQAGVVDPAQPGGWALSNGLELVICAP